MPPLSAVGISGLQAGEDVNQGIEPQLSTSKRGGPDKFVRSIFCRYLVSICRPFASQWQMGMGSIVLLSVAARPELGRSDHEFPPVHRH